MPDLESVEESLKLGACLIVMQSWTPVVLLHQLCQFHKLQAVVYDGDHVLSEVWNLQHNHQESMVTITSFVTRMNNHQELPDSLFSHIVIRTKSCELPFDSPGLYICFP